MPTLRSLAPPLLSRFALLCAVSLAGGCAGSRAATRAPEGVAVAAAGGVSLAVPRVETGARPDTPVKDSLAVYVVIENQGAQEIVIAKEDFGLGARGGARHAAICPEYLASVASWASSPVRGRVVRAGGFSDLLYLPPSGQPTAAVRGAIDSLPDGTLGPGGRAAGYLYFPRASARPGQPLELDWRVRDEASQQPLAELKVRLRSLEPAAP